MTMHISQPPEKKLMANTLLQVISVLLGAVVQYVYLFIAKYYSIIKNYACIRPLQVVILFLALAHISS